MYLVVAGWLYVALMMAAAEATASNGSILGAIVTFFLYGLLPLALVVYLMSTPQRKRVRQALRQRAATPEAPPDSESLASIEPDTGGHAPGAAQPDGVTPVRKKP